MIAEFIQALNEEIEAIKAGKGSTPVRVINGQRLRQHGGIFFYSFALENFITTIDDAPVEVWIGNQRNQAQIIQAQGLEVVVGFERDLGETIPEARLILNLYFLHEILRKKFEALKEGEISRSFALADRVFAGRVSTRRESIPLPPLESGRMPNPSQQEAIQKSQDVSLSLVWGPPGTGKTATIARIVECFVKRGLRVLVVAHANAAVDEVTEDIADVLKTTSFYNEGKILRLGNHQKESLEERYNLVLRENIAQRLGTTLQAEKNQLLDSLLLLEDQLTQLAKVSRFIEDRDVYERRGRELINALIVDTRRIAQIEKQLVQQENEAQQLTEKLHTAETAGVLKRLFSGLKPAHVRRQMDQATVARDAMRRQHQELRARQQHNERQKSEAEERLSALRRSYTLSLQPLGLSEFEVRERVQALDRKRDEINSRISQLQTQLDDVQKRVLVDARVICTTLTKTFTAKELPDNPFDVLILDEASMAPMPYLYWALGFCRQAAVIAGDFLQLPPICIANAGMAQKWLGRSIYYQLGVCNVDEAKANPIVSLLNTQYRMHPSISAIANGLFYGGLLHDDPTARNRVVDDGLGQSPLTTVDTSLASPWCSRLSGGGRFNLYHALLAANVAQKIVEGAAGKFKIGIISPYAAQARLIGKMLRDVGLDREVRVATVHRFQGGEEDIIIFDTVEGAGVRVAPMLDDTQEGSAARLLLNVAFTRAKAKVILLAYCDYLRLQLPAASVLAKILNRFGEGGNRIDSNSLIDSFFVKDHQHWIDRAVTNKISGGVAPPEGSLYSERNFYAAFFADIGLANQEVIIMSPFLSIRRSGDFVGLLRVLTQRGVRVRLFTKPAQEQTGELAMHAAAVIQQMKANNVQVIERPKMHQKVAIIDRRVAWEGSLNILSHRDSGEQMRRLPYATAVNELIRLFDLDEASSKSEPAGAEPVRTAKPCPLCRKDMIVRVSESVAFLSCPDLICKGRQDITRRDRIVTEVKCKTCSSFMVVRTGANGPFLGCSNYPSCKQTLPLR